MALEYEIRSEFASLSLAQLLDAPITCFQGVGDTQSEILGRVFGVTTVRQLARLRCFLWALAIQDQALHAKRPGDAVPAAEGKPARFEIRARDRDKDPATLLKSPVQVLEGLTPLQNLALYDAFRVTTVLQLAHNRIMLEARVIEYLERHPEAAEALTGSKADIASILGAEGGTEAETLPGAGADLRQAEGQITEHVRDRLEVLKERARQRASALPSRDSLSADELRADAARLRLPGAGAGRMDALRETRERMAETRTPTGARSGRRGSVAARVADLGARREAPAARTAPAARVSAVGRAGAASGVTALRDSIASRRAEARAGGASTRTEAVRETAGGEPAPAASGTTTARRPPASRAAAGEEPATTRTVQGRGAAPAAAAAAPAQRPAPPRPGAVPWLIAAAILLAIGGGLWLWMGRQKPPTETIQVAPETPSGAVPQQASAPRVGPGQGPAGDGTVGPNVGTGGGAVGTSVGGTAGTLPETAPSAERRKAGGQAGIDEGAPKEGPPIQGIHTVQEGQSLWRISRRYLSDPRKWPAIFRANQDKIGDPNLIYPRQQFKIPKK